MRLEMIHQERTRWRNQCRLQVAMASTKTQKDKLADVVRSNKARAEQFSIMTRAMALKLKGRYNNIKPQSSITFSIGFYYHINNFHFHIYIQDIVNYNQ